MFNFFKKEKRKRILPDKLHIEESQSEEYSSRIIIDHNALTNKIEVSVYILDETKEYAKEFSKVLYYMGLNSAIMPTICSALALWAGESSERKIFLGIIAKEIAVLAEEEILLNEEEELEELEEDAVDPSDVFGLKNFNQKEKP